MTNIHWYHIASSTINVFLTHQKRNKAMSINNYLNISIQSCQLIGFWVTFSCQLKFLYCLHRDHILAAPIIYDQTINFIFDGACRVEGTIMPLILIWITIRYQKTLSDHKGCILISMQNTPIFVQIIFVVSKIHGLLLY